MLYIALDSIYHFLSPLIQLQLIELFPKQTSKLFLLLDQTKVAIALKKNKLSLLRSLLSLFPINILHLTQNGLIPMHKPTRPYFYN